MGSAAFRLAASIVIAIAVAAAPAASARESAGVRLTFARNGSIFVASANGRNAAVYLRGVPSRRSQRSDTFNNPTWSADGTALAANAIRSGERDDPTPIGSWGVIVRRGLRPPFSLCSDCYDASWSPNGRHLVVVGEIQGWDYGYSSGALKIIDALSARPRPRSLTPTERSTGDGPTDGTPAWSPDGNLIAFVRVGDSEPPEYREPPPRLYVIAPNGRGTRRLTTGRGFNPSWSPDGRYIAFDNGRSIGIVGRRGGPVRFITTGVNPAWSPDGRTIALLRGRSIWLVDRNGRRPRLAIRNASDPGWRR